MNETSLKIITCMTSATHLEEIKERDMLDQLAEIVSVLEEEHVRQPGVDDVRMTSRQTHEIESLLTTVASAEERYRRLVLPLGARLALHRQHVKRYPAKHRVKHII